MISNLLHDFAEVLNVMPPEHPTFHHLKLLDDAIQHDAGFVDRHRDDYPQALFQSLWNQCWWHDCHEAAEHDLPNGGGWEERSPQSHAGQKLSARLRTWLREKAARTPDLRWLRALRPPPDWSAPPRIMYTGHNASVSSISWSTDDNRIATGSADGNVRVWDPKVGTDLECIIVSSRIADTEVQCCSVVFQQDNQHLVCLTTNGTIYVWHVPSNTVIATWEACCNCTIGALAADDLHFAICCQDGSIRLWDIRSGHEIHWLPGHSKSVQQAILLPDTNHLATASHDGTIRVWDFVRGREIRCLRLKPGTAFQTNAPKLKDVALGIADRSSAINAFTYLPAISAFAVGLFDGTIRLLNAVSGEETQCLSGHHDTITSLFVNKAGTTFASTSLDGTIRLWDVRTCRESACITIPGGEAFTGGFSQDGTHVAIALASGRVAVWNVGINEHEFRSLANHSGPILSGSFSADGSELVTSSADTTIRLWNVKTGEERHCFRGHDGPVSFVAFSSDGQRIISQSPRAAASMASDFLALMQEVQSRGMANARLPQVQPSKKSVWVWEKDGKSAPQVIEILPGITPPAIADERLPCPWKVNSDRQGTAFESINSLGVIARFPDPLERVTYSVAHGLLAATGRLHISDSIHHLYVLHFESLAESVKSHKSLSPIRPSWPSVNQQNELGDLLGKKWFRIQVTKDGLGQVAGMCLLSCIAAFFLVRSWQTWPLKVTANIESMRIEYPTASHSNFRVMAELSYSVDGEAYTATMQLFASPTEERATEQIKIGQQEKTTGIWCHPETPGKLMHGFDVVVRWWIFASVGIGIFAVAYSEFNKRRSRPFGGARQSVQSQVAERG